MDFIGSDNTRSSTQLGSKINIGGINYSANQERLYPLIEKTVNAPKFRKWIESTVRKGVVRFNHIQFTDIDMFGPNLGFAKFKVMLDDGLPEDNEGKLMGNIVFLRGDSVAVLPVVAEAENGDNRTVIVVEQTKIPSCGKLLEICAGMVDENTGDVKGVAVKELEEECGVKINARDLIPLGAMMPSGGGCDEEISLFASELVLPRAKLQELNDKIQGENEMERIHLRMIDYELFDDYLDTMGDPKAECSWRRYQKHLKYDTRRDIKRRR